MNFLVFLNGHASELEKILSGTKTMVVNEFDPKHAAGCVISPGDSLYFLRSKEECTLQVIAVVARVQIVTNQWEEELTQFLKEMQPKLQLTEDQYNAWSAKKYALLVEFESAHKINAIQIAAKKTKDRSDWIPFKEIRDITE